LVGALIGRTIFTIKARKIEENFDLSAIEFKIHLKFFKMNQILTMQKSVPILVLGRGLVNERERDFLKLTKNYEDPVLI
jgi:hypothetical protein